MFKLAISTSLLFLVSIVGSAQTPPECPTITVRGPSGIPAPGELITFTATISGKLDSLNIEYKWSVSSGEIKSGQGTPSITVDPKDRSITATLEVRGLPRGCTALASERYGGDPVPQAVKLHELRDRELFDDAAERILLASLRGYPNNQIYVLSGEVVSSPNNWLDSRESWIRASLYKNNIDVGRVTFARTKSESTFTQLWRVPPGASNPRCDECEAWFASIKDCPAITVTGPAGVVLPGEMTTFVADVTGDKPEKLFYSWEVTDGAMMGGQNTNVLKARYSNSATFLATVRVHGLPAGCPDSASETVYVSGPEPVPEHLATINTPEYTIGKLNLDRIVAAMSEPNSQLYVWIYVGSLPTNRHEPVRSYVLRQLSTTTIDPTRFTIQLSAEKPQGAIFWRVPPGSMDPGP